MGKLRLVILDGDGNVHSVSDDAEIYFREPADDDDDDSCATPEDLVHDVRVTIAQVRGQDADAEPIGRS